jgi:hypothetical protein
MIVWLGLIGNMIKFMVEKLASKRIDLAMDQKRKAGRIFVRVHEILERLCELSQELSENIDQPTVNGLHREAWLFNVDEEITLLSNEFLHLTDQFHDVLRIFDPNLSKTLSGLVYYKFSMLVLASHSFKRLSREDNPSMMIEYVYPNADLLTIDFEEHYNWLAENPDYFKNNEFDGEDLEWPNNVLVSTFGIHESTQQDTVRSGSLEEQAEDIRRLRALLQIHRSFLAEANKKLREFIVSNFSIADVL